MTQVTEELTTELVKKAQNGDLRAFEQLLGEYQGKIYNIALGIMGNPHDAEDAVQNALIKIYRAIGSFKHRSKFSTWVYRVATNVCMDEVRKKKRTSSVSSDELGEEIFSSDINTPEANAINNEKMLHLKKAISSLRDDHRRVIVLRDINGFSYEEIACITSSSVGTVKSRINRARASLKDILISTGYDFCERVVKNDRL